MVTQTHPTLFGLPFEFFEYGFELTVCVSPDVLRELCETYGSEHIALDTFARAGITLLDQELANVSMTIGFPGTAPYTCGWPKFRRTVLATRQHDVERLPEAARQRLHETTFLRARQMRRRSPSTQAVQPVATRDAGGANRETRPNGQLHTRIGMPRRDLQLDD